MNATVFNPIQLHLLEMFSYMDSQQELQEVQTILTNYYFDKIDRLGTQLAAQNGWTDETLQEMSEEHLRTPYK